MSNDECRFVNIDFEIISPKRAKDNSPVQSAGIWNEIKIVRNSPLQKKQNIYPGLNRT